MSFSLSTIQTQTRAILPQKWFQTVMTTGLIVLGFPQHPSHSNPASFEDTEIKSDLIQDLKTFEATLDLPTIHTSLETNLKANLPTPDASAADLLPKSENQWFVADANLSQSEQLNNLWTSGRPDGHAPIGVMGDHTHSIGEVMLSYRYMRMGMSGNLDGTTNLTPTQVLQQFPVTPLRMSTDMHMFGAMYAPTNRLTLMGMVPYITKEMDHQTRMGDTFTTRSSGFGDISFGGLYKILDKNRHRVHLNFGSSFPTGSTNRRDDTPAGPNQVLPYPMQLGSGTVDLQPGVTYLGQSDQWSWGGQVLGKIRLGTNENSYRLGNEINGTAWGARRWTDWLSTSLRLNAKNWGDISGADPRLNPAIIPTADPELRGGTRVDLGFGLNLLSPKGPLKGGRFGVEFALPVFQSLDGPQLETDWTLTAGIQYAF